jgi:uncharacterized protein YcaQ
MARAQRCKWTDVAAFRLGRHHLADSPASNLIAACSDPCGIQAQVMGSAYLALRARMRGVTSAEIQAALWQDRTLVKTSCMRQTLHLLPAAEFSTCIAALRASRVAAVRRVMARCGVTGKEAAALNEAAVDALRDGPLTQAQLRVRITPQMSKSVRAWMKLVWNIMVLKPAIAEGLICYGPQKGQEITVVRVDQWLPAQKNIAETEARNILLRRYLRAYGPATVGDFSRWSGMPMSEARPVWHALQDELAEVDVEGQKAWILAADAKQLAHAGSSRSILRLLPAFDPYLLAHVDKNHLVPAQHYKRIYRGAGWISPVILLDGRIIGTWSYKRQGGRLRVGIVPFARLTRSIRSQINGEAASLGSFLEASPEIEIANDG